MASVATSAINTARSSTRTQPNVSSGLAWRRPFRTAAGRMVFQIDVSASLRMQHETRMTSVWPMRAR